ncbi:pyridoxal-phosphate dependent enzyme [Clostridium estertheticum]|uniref:pyridoxal-phosphate dependent enzyme n=1 Tax=Clostridium estertheticum TaxID=238834 RepID=UPI001C0CF61C|nr:pyridoxal-phosphate dependent enzyme [Clostridium estertheticum]MBU3072149.1 pyridoxal-phosphate dependent enzyme [Clostridium estertheticum]MBU3162241.1 pyridoxal-phosphate dependent enzyme [Clostridium estertheticum]MBU3170672.1 pyridoxal-phosphate dependent enzyme [Clostridium estertheticum]
MRKSGRTPLMRAKKLEKALGISEIYLKLEGANPSGHKYDRISEVLVKDAIANGFKKILVDGSECYIQSVQLFAKLNELEIKVPLFKQEKWKISRIDKSILFDMRDKKDTITRSNLREIAEKNNMYLMCEWNLNNIISHLVLEDMTRECLERMDFKADTITIQLGLGYTLSSVYSGLIKSWVHEELCKLPELICGSNPSWKDSMDEYVRKMQIGGIKSKEKDTAKPHLYMEDDYTGIVATVEKIIMDTRAEMIEIEEIDLKNAANMLRDVEGVMVSRKESYAMAAFIKKANQGKLSNGKHLIILNDARSEIEVCEIKSFNDKNKEELLEMTRDWLSTYNDSVGETVDAIEKAMKEGFLLIAKRNGEEQGICIVVNMGFERFIPTYHLAYIGVKPGNKGRGVASELIGRAIELTDGNLSLHVDLDNKRAKNLYRKMGFNHVYDRMIYNHPNE